VCSAGFGALGRNGTYVGLRKYQSRVGAFNRFLHANTQTDDEWGLLAANWSAAGAAVPR
jgi:hypothetical protein